MQRLLHKGFLFTGCGSRSIHVRYEKQFCAFASLRLCVRFLWMFISVAGALWVADSARFGKARI